MLRFKDYEVNGQVDWAAYRKAEIQQGERCRKCGSGILFGQGFPSDCGDCQRASKDDGELRHNSMIRCPKCRKTWVVDGDDEIYEEGTHSISCPQCETEFEVETYVSLSYGSPAVDSTPAQ